MAAAAEAAPLRKLWPEYGDGSMLARVRHWQTFLMQSKRVSGEWDTPIVNMVLVGGSGLVVKSRLRDSTAQNAGSANLAMRMVRPLRKGSVFKAGRVSWT